MMIKKTKFQIHNYVFAIALIFVLASIIFSSSYNVYANRKNVPDCMSATQSDMTKSESIYNIASRPNISKNKNYTSNDVFYLAAVICQESGGESLEAQQLVASVVLNRVESHLFPNSIKDVLLQKSQYGLMWKNGIKFPEWADKDTIIKCKKVAKRMLESDKRTCPKNVLYQAEFKQGSGLYKEVDGIYFCYY